MLSAFRGVKLRLLEEDPFDQVRVESMPLLAPNTEAEFSRESWNYVPAMRNYLQTSIATSQRGQVNSNLLPPAGKIVQSAVEIATSRRLVPNFITAAQGNGDVAHNWEENFQDLSDWCESTIQGRRDYPAGEFSALGTKGTLGKVFFELVRKRI